MKKWEGENENANGKFMREKDLSKEMEGGRVLNFGCYQRKDALSHGLAGKECKEDNMDSRYSKEEASEVKTLGGGDESFSGEH